MKTIVVNKDSSLMQMLRKAKERKEAWQNSIKDELDEMQKQLIASQQHLQ